MVMVAATVMVYDGGFNKSLCCDVHTTSIPHARLGGPFARWSRFSLVPGNCLCIKRSLHQLRVPRAGYAAQELVSYGTCGSVVQPRTLRT